MKNCVFLSNSNNNYPKKCYLNFKHKGGNKLQNLNRLSSFLKNYKDYFQLKLCMFANWTTCIELFFRLKLFVLLWLYQWLANFICLCKVILKVIKVINKTSCYFDKRFTYRWGIRSWTLISSSHTSWPRILFMKYLLSQILL